MSLSASLAEIFSSFQGEGIHVGARQVFVRLRGCELTCKYCDTPEARGDSGTCRVEREPGSNQWAEVTNPLTVETAAELIGQLVGTAPHHSVSITGGEPLLHPDFVGELFQQLKTVILSEAKDLAGLRTYLDTACCYPQAMTEVAPYVDIVAADYKLPATLREPIAFDDFAQSWQAIKGERFLKIVLTQDVLPDDLAEHCRRLAALDADAQVVLQPATPMGAVRPPDRVMLFALANVAAEHLPSARVIPQCHHLLGVN